MENNILFMVKVLWKYEYFMNVLEYKYWVHPSISNCVPEYKLQWVWVHQIQPCYILQLKDWSLNDLAGTNYVNDKCAMFQVTAVQNVKNGK